jgi:hypothetical protein
VPYNYKLQEGTFGPFPYYYMIPNTTIYSLFETLWASGPSKLRVVGLQITHVLYSVGLFNMPMPSHVLCPLCDGTDETIDHITLHCGFTRGICAGPVARLHLLDIMPTGVLGIADWWLLALPQVSCSRAQGGQLAHHAIPLGRAECQGFLMTSESALLRL